MSVEEHLRELELELLRPVTRGSLERLSILLAEDFREFGCSGQIFSRDDIIEALRAGPRTRFSISDFRARILSEGVALITYQAAGREEANDREIVSLRSSLWVIRDGRWQMLFHQGTKVPHRVRPEL